MKNKLTITIEQIKNEKEIIDSEEFYSSMGTIKSIIFSKDKLKENELRFLFSLFIMMVKEVTKENPDYEDFLLSRSYLFPKVEEETSGRIETLRIVFLLIERDFSDMYLCKSRTPNTVNLFRYLSVIQKMI